MSGSREASIQWTTDQSDMLTFLIKDDTSFTKAAELLNIRFCTQFTRCAVAGKAKRLGLSEPRKISLGPKRKPVRKSRTTPDQRPDIAVRKTATKQHKPAPFIPRTVDIRTENVTLLELAEDGCRYPNGDHAPFLFCNHPQVEGSYCGPHADLCFRGRS